MIDVAQLAGFSGIPLVIALIQVAKATFPKAPASVWPCAALGIAVAWNEGVAAVLHTDFGVAALAGIVVGLSASGLYSHAATFSMRPPPSADRESDAATILSNAGASDVRVVQDPTKPARAP